MGNNVEQHWSVSIKLEHEFDQDETGGIGIDTIRIQQGFYCSSADDALMNVLSIARHRLRLAEDQITITHIDIIPMDER